MWDGFMKLFEPTLVIGAVTWLAQTTITKFFERRTEEFKSELEWRTEVFKTSLQRRTDVFENELKKAALEHEVQFRRNDEKFADVLSKIYGRLSAYHRAVQSFVAEWERTNEPSKEEKLKSAADANRELTECLLNDRLYIPDSLYKRVNALANNLAKIAYEFKSGQRREQSGLISDDDDYWGKAVDAVNDEAKPLLDEILAAFQKRLGIAY
jgi:hypothetical protein